MQASAQSHGVCTWSGLQWGNQFSEGSTLSYECVRCPTRVKPQDADAFDTGCDAYHFINVLASTLESSGLYWWRSVLACGGG